MGLRDYITQYMNRGSMSAKILVLAGLAAVTGCNEELTREISTDLVMTGARQAVVSGVRTHIEGPRSGSGYVSENVATEPAYQSEEERQATAEALNQAYQRDMLIKQQEQKATVTALQGAYERDMLIKQRQDQQRVKGLQEAYERDMLKKQQTQE